MEKAAAGALAGSRRALSLGRCAAVALGWCAICPIGWAADGGTSTQDLLLAQAKGEPGIHFDVNASTLPRMDAQDSNSFQAPRVDLAVTPKDHDALGFVIGLSNLAPRNSGLLPPAFGSGPNVDLGLRWRQLFYSKQVDVMAWRRLSNEQDAYTLIQENQPVYGARVEMKLSGVTPKEGFNAGAGFVGFQLEGGARIQLRGSARAPMLYYRSDF